MKKKPSLPWSKSSYRALEPTDLAPHPAPTPEQRVRVAAAVATHIRDANMLSLPCSANAETIRAILTMGEEAWARDIPDAAAIIVAYDTEDPKTRWLQTAGRRS